MMPDRLRAVNNPSRLCPVEARAHRHDRATL